MNREHWVLATTGTRHVLDILPSVSGSLQILVDARRVARMDNVSRHYLRSETAFRLDGHEVIVAIDRRTPERLVDIFVDGISQTDGFDIVSIRGDTPPQRLRGYDRLFRPPAEGPHLGSTTLLAVVIAWIIATVAIFAVPLEQQTPRALAGVAWFVAWVIGWYAVAARVNSRMLYRPDLGSAHRLAITATAFLIYPVIPFAVVYLISLVVPLPMKGS